MKIPEEIKGKNKLRDWAICDDYCNGKSPAVIKVSRNLPISVRRIEAIIYDNRPYVNKYIGWDKSKRLNHLIRLVNENPSKLGKNTGTLDILKEIRIELEGDKPLIHNEKHIHYTTVIEQIHDLAKKREGKDDSGVETRNRMRIA